MRTALITGVSRGIGRAIADALAADDWEILAPSRRELDLADPASVTAYCASLADRTVDALVNNAGINILGTLDAVRDADWAAMLQVNVTSPFKLAQAVAPGMRARQWGRILNIASVFGIVSRDARAPYTTTKAAIIGMTRTLAIELGPDNILVNALCPGYVKTDLTYQNNPPEEIAAIEGRIPLRRMASVEEIAKTAAYLCSEANCYITGQAIIADGGFTCL